MIKSEYNLFSTLKLITILNKIKYKWLTNCTGIQNRPNHCPVMSLCDFIAVNTYGTQFTDFIQWYNRGYNMSQKFKL